MTKEINGIEYIVYEAGMNLNQPDKSFYFEDDLDYDGNVNCLHVYAVKQSIVRGNQYVRGYQYVGNKDTVNLLSDDRNYKKIEQSFNVAKNMKPLLISMNDKKSES